MNWKLIVIGGIVYYVVQWIVGMGTGPLIHEGVLESVYRETAAFWRPELNQDPPDIAALLPRWITTGVIVAFISAALYGWLRPAFSGAGWLKGLKFGLLLFVVTGTLMASWSGVFNIPERIWVWWFLESLLYYAAGGAALGWVAERVAPSQT